MFVVSNQQLCRTTHVKNCGSWSSRKLCICIYRGAILSKKC